MSQRPRVTKTFKLFIGGAFPRSESGRVVPIGLSDDVVAYAARASRKDLRDAVEAATAAQPGWAKRDAWNRGQILFRMAEMIESRRDEFVRAIRMVDGSDMPLAAAKNNVDDAITRLVGDAGWCDKIAQILGCRNPVAGPYHNFTMPEPVGVVGVVAPECEDPKKPAFASMISVLAAAIAGGNTTVLLAAETNPAAAVLLAEVCATSDVPAGVINILTGMPSELFEHLASHRGIDAIVAAHVDDDAAATLRAGAAENVKRVTILDDVDPADGNPMRFESTLEMKTMWHPASV